MAAVVSLGQPNPADAGVFLSTNVGPDGVEPTLDVCRFSRDKGRPVLDCTPIPKADAARLRGNPKLQAVFLARARRSPTRAIRWLRRVSRPVRRRRLGSRPSLRRPRARQRRKVSAARRSLGAVPARCADGDGDGDPDGEPALHVALLDRRLPCPLCGHNRKRIRRSNGEFHKIAKPKPATGPNIRLRLGRSYTLAEVAQLLELSVCALQARMRRASEHGKKRFVELTPWILGYRFGTRQWSFSARADEAEQVPIALSNSSTGRASGSHR
jgi:hypothetical protein